MTCSIEDCARKVFCRCWCSAHYERWRRWGNPLGGRVLNGTLKKWLLVHVGYAGSDCLLWPFGRTTEGYGTVSWNGEKKSASRVMCELANGPPPSRNLDSAHKCGNGHLGCVHPKHMKWATRAQNQADRLLHGTHQRGSKNHKSKLTDNDVLNIVAALKCGQTQKSLASAFSVNFRTISQIATGKRWGWLTQEKELEA